MTPQRRITAELVRVLCDRGYTPIERAVHARVGNILKDIADPAEVELVCLYLVREAGAGYSTNRTLSWAAYEMMRVDLKIPHGAWEYALWRDKTTNPRVLRSIDHWLIVWKDGLKEGIDIDVNLAKTMLAKLLEYDGAEAIEV